MEDATVSLAVLLHNAARNNDLLGMGWGWGGDVCICFNIKFMQILQVTL